MKSQIRNKLVALFLAAVATSCFITACGSSDTTNPDQTSSVFGNDEINNAISTTTSNTAESPVVSMKFKEWYDAQDATDAAGDRKDTGSSLVNNLFIVYENDEYPDGFIVSGRTIVPLEDSAIPSNTHGLRLESTGQRINFLDAEKLETLDETLAEFDEVVDAAAMTQLTTLEDRMNLAEDETESPVNGTAVFFNNYKTSLTYEDGVDLVALFSEFKDYATVLTSAESFSFDIYTAAGTRSIMFALKSAEEFEVSYGDEENSTAIVTAKSIPATSLFATPDILEDVFGYQVETYDGTLNIVTDNKDLFTDLTTVPASSLAEPIAQPEGPTMDEIKQEDPIITTDNPEPEPIEELQDVEPVFSDSTGPMYCTGSAVNIRSSYSTSSTSLGKLSKGDKIEVDGYGFANGNEWYRFRYNGNTAYAVTMYFSSTKPKTPFDSAPSSNNSNGSEDFAYKGKYTQPDGVVKDIVIDSDGHLTVNGYEKLGIHKFVNGKLYSYSKLYKEWYENTESFEDTAGGAIEHDTSDLQQNDDNHYGEM